MFLVVLLADIVDKGLPAFTEHRLVIDGHGRSRRDRSAGHARIRTSSAPATSTRSSARRCGRCSPTSTARAGAALLDGLLSVGRGGRSARARRRRSGADRPDRQVPVLLSDDADLYLKGRHARSARSRDAASRRRAAPTGESRSQHRPHDFADARSSASSAICPCAPAPRAKPTGSQRIARAANAARQARGSLARRADRPPIRPLAAIATQGRSRTSRRSLSATRQAS